MKWWMTGVAAAALLVSLQPANAVLVADGITYTLTEADTASALTDRFTLTITGINAAADTEKGRAGVNAIAFTTPTGFTTATFIPPPTGFVFVSGGLNSGGCDASGGFFCFDNTAIANGGGVSALPPLGVNSSLTFVFDVTTATGNFAGYDPHLKIDWVGSNNNYDLVSLAVGITGTCVDCTPTPQITVVEPASILALGSGLVGMLGGAGWIRRRRNT